MEEIKSPPKQHSASPAKPKYQFKAEEFQEKMTLLCRFCGGERCPQQDYRTNKKQPNAIEGLHSNWITQNILAMQRPSERLITKHNLYAAWNKQNITTILNLQEPGEHPYCGDGIVGHHGFSYIPDKLYSHNIRFFNFSWEDMTATTCEFMMKIMDIFDHTFQKGEKIAVHCHAGRGRTLMAICGWLIFSGEFTAKQSIELAIQRREGVLTRNSQRQFLYQFQNFLKTKRKVFGLIIKLPFETIVERHQSAILQRKKSKCKNIPYIHYLITEEIMGRLYKEEKPMSVEIIINAIKGTNWSDADTKALSEFKHWCNQMRVDHSAIKNYKIEILFEGLFDYFDEIAFNLIDTHSCEHLEEYYKEGQKLIDILMSTEIISSVGSYVICTLLSFVKFITEFKAFGLQKQFLELMINRVVKCLTSKKKYNRTNFEGRFLKATPTFTKHESFIKMLIVHGIQQDKITAQKFEGIERTIRKKNADIFFHKNSLKEEHEKEYFEEHVIKEKVYKKIK